MRGGAPLEEAARAQQADELDQPEDAHHLERLERL